MTYHTKHHKRTFGKNQAGVTLLIALLILSTVMAISFSLASILLSETKSSGDLLRTEPALYGANGVTEEAIYSVKRNTGETSYNSVGNMQITTTATPLNDPVQVVKVPTNATSFNNTQNVYALYDVSNPYDAGKYSRIQVTFLDTNTPGTQIHIFLCQWDPKSPPTNADGSYANICSEQSPSPSLSYSYISYPDTNPLSPGQTWDTSGSPPGNFSCGGCMNPNYQQELIIYQGRNTGYPPNNAYVQIKTFDNNGNPKGIPYFGQTAVGISATNGGVSRNIRAVIPNVQSSPSSNTTNYAAAVNGGVSSASTQYFDGQYPASSAINGDRRGVGWGSGGGGWNDNTNNDWSNDWLAVAFSGPKSLSEMDVYSIADGYPLAADPGSSDTFTLYGLTDFEAQYSTNNGGSWADVPGGSVTGNNLIWNKFTFSTIPNVTNIRILIHNSLDLYSRIVELEAY
jgi:hypothetical protein